MRTYRSPLRLFAFGLVGIILIVAAIDVMFGHWLSTAPEDTNGTLTTRGQAQQRGDILWGAALIGAGTLLVGGSVVELVRRKSLVVVTADGLVMAIGLHEADVVTPWSAVEDVTSDTVVDPYDGAVREVLVVALSDRTGVPAEPLGATWDGDTLLIDAHDWTRRVTDVALSAQGALGHYRRVEEIKQMGPPSVEWDSEGDNPQDLASDAQVAAGMGVIASTAGGDDSADDTVARGVDEDPTPDIANEAGVVPAPDQSAEGVADGQVTIDEGPTIDGDAGFGDTPIDPEVSEAPVATAAVTGAAWPSHDDADTPHEEQAPAESRAESEAGSSDNESMGGSEGDVDDSGVFTDRQASGDDDDAGDEDDPGGATSPLIVAAAEPDPQQEYEPAAPPQSTAGAFGAARFGAPRPARTEPASGDASLQRPDEDPPGRAEVDGEPGRGDAP